MVTRAMFRTLALKRASTYSECILPGEPMIYSVKLKHANRRITFNKVRTEEFKRILKCFYPNYRNKTVPIVILVRFYVSPRQSAEVGWKDVRSEKKPAIGSFEIADYLLAFMEILKDTVFKHYQQIVKIDVQKFYSKNPRTCFKIMTWSDYGEFQNTHPDNAEGKGLGARRKSRVLQSKLDGNVQGSGLREKASERNRRGTSTWAVVSDISLQDTSKQHGEGSEATAASHDASPNTP